MIELKNLVANEAPKRYMTLADIGQYVEVKNVDMTGEAMIIVRVDDIDGEKFIGT